MIDTGVRDLLDQNPIVGTPKTGPKRFWTNPEIKVVRAHFPNGGVPACLPLLPGRSASAIYNRAGQLGLHASERGRSGPPRERWASSDTIDGVIQRAYQKTPTKGDIQKVAQTIGRPRWWVSRRASHLGLVTPRFKAEPWSQVEIDYIEANAHHAHERLSRALRRMGYGRTPTAIKVQLKRLGASTEDPDHFTSRGLATLLGVDSKVVTRWITNDWLKAKRRGTARVDVQGGDEWWIHRKDVRRFVVENASAVDIRKVDKFWFIDLLAVAA